METWRDVKNYEGIYQVSNLGNIRSLPRTDSHRHKWDGKMLSQKIDEKGYRRVHLSKDGKAKWYSVHRIVAQAFIENSNPKFTIINHLDNNPSNNRVDNLEWTDAKGNMQWATKQGRMRYNPDNLRKAQESKKVGVIATLPNGDRRYFASQVEAGKALNVMRSHIAACCRQEYGYKTLKGIKFEYADGERQKNAIPKKTAMPEDLRRELNRKRMMNNKLMVGRTLSEETRKKLSIANGIPVVQLDSNLNEIKRFISINEAFKQTGIRHIDAVVRGDRKTAGGYHWRRL